MRLSDGDYQNLRRLHSLSGLLPVALFLVAHFLSNATAIRGPRAYERLAEALDGLPGVRLVEILLIGLPILAHVVLGILLGNAAQSIDRPTAYPQPWMAGAQRATGGFLVVYVIFHVWWTRLSPEVLGGADLLFAVTRRVLEHPGILAFHAMGVLAASAHLGLGLIGFAGHWGIRHPRLERLGLAGFLVLSAIGLNALFAFVSRPARWLEPRSNAAAPAIDRDAATAPAAADAGRGAPPPEAR